MKETKNIVLAIFFLMHHCVYADGEILDLLVPSITISEESQISYTAVESLLADRYFEEAIALAEEIFENNNFLKTTKPIAYGKLATNLAIVFSYAGQHEDSIAMSEKALAHLEPLLPQFSPELISVILARSYTLLSLIHI